MRMSQAAAGRKIIRTLFDNVHRPLWKVAVLSQNQDFGHAAFWLILAKKVRVPVVAKAQFVESGPPGARQPWWREHRADRDRNRFPPGISPLALRRPSCSQKMIFIKRSCTWSPTVISIPRSPDGGREALKFNLGVSHNNLLF